MSEVVNILIASVGGQGGLTLSRVIALAAVADGKSVRTGETLGMAQRFGSVVSYVRVGKEVHAPMFGYGEAHAILGLELIEVSRNLHYLSNGASLFTADELKPPISSSLGIADNPRKADLIKEICSKARKVKGKVYVVSAKELAAKLGNPRAMNMIVLGAFNREFKILSDSAIEKAITQLLPGKKGETSIKAYYVGKSLNIVPIC